MIVCKGVTKMTWEVTNNLTCRHTKTEIVIISYFKTRLRMQLTNLFLKTPNRNSTKESENCHFKDQKIFRVKANKESKLS